MRVLYFGSRYEFEHGTGTIENTGDGAEQVIRGRPTESWRGTLPPVFQTSKGENYCVKIFIFYTKSFQFSAITIKIKILWLNFQI